MIVYNGLPVCIGGVNETCNRWMVHVHDCQQRDVLVGGWCWGSERMKYGVWSYMHMCEFECMNW